MPLTYKCLFVKKAKMIISLIGFMGCGKSSVGRRLSELLCCRFIDLDNVIEEREGRTIAEIFAEDGEAGFRNLELKVLDNIVCKESAGQWAPLAPSHFVGPSPTCYRRLFAAKVHWTICKPLTRVRRCQFHPNASPISETIAATETVTFFDLSTLHNDQSNQHCHPEFSSCHPERSEVIDEVAEANAKESPILVLSLGGGTVMTPQCAELVKEKTLCIYLKASVDTLMERLASETESRPLLCQNISSSMPAEEAEEARRNHEAEQPDLLLRNCIEALLAERSATYENTASIIIDTDGKSISAIANEILANC